uniref:probable WRKY transcription factor 70 n=1 Tax=Erigeron canadensis TaxID=72917 RepID=UPI001CB9A9C2|nr:probable WRKY transcription factor 70 [Erigeron canadensis]
MESTSWPEILPSNRIQAIQELTQGQESINILQEMLWWPKTDVSNFIQEDGLVVQVLGMFENALSIMSSCPSNEVVQLTTRDVDHSLCSSDEQKSKSSNENLETTKPEKNKKGCYKRRKNAWTSTQIASILVDDGHAWRKYGQKTIMNSEFQRSYYRCSYKHDQGCQATKHVEMIQDSPPKYKTTYIGEHTCKNLLRAPEIILDLPDPRETSVLLSFDTKGFVGKKQVIPNFSSIKLEPKEQFPSIGNVKHHDPFSYNKDPSCDPNTTYVSQIPLNLGDISSEGYSYMPNTNTYGYDHPMNYVLQRNDFKDFPDELRF